MRILNLGAGVQSTTIFLMAHEGLVPPIDHAIFADTQEEPQAVYEHLAWLKRVPSPVPIIHTGTVGKISDHLLRGQNARGGRFATIPAFTAPGEPIEPFKTDVIKCKKKKRKIGKLRRQCTKEYKTEVVERIIRRIIFGLKARQRMPKDVVIDQIFGISADESRRAVKISKRFEVIKWAKPSFPLIEMGMSREDCQKWLATRVPHEVQRSACVFCPYKSSEEWLKTKQSPDEWARAVEVDSGIRVPGVIVARGMDQPIYLHRSAIPLQMVDLEAEAKKEAARNRRSLFELMECGEGMCGV